jgi:hypothetical protein
MKKTVDRTRPVAAQASAPRKPFRIEKLEERLAPKKGGNGTNNCPSGPGTSIIGSSIY